MLVISPSPFSSFRVDATLMSSFKDSLTEISLSYNHLHVLPADLIQSMSKLKVIDLCKNRIDVISTRWRVDNLHKILLAANFLTAVDLPTFFAHSPLLTLLDLSFNRIERLGIGAFGNLPLLDTLFLQASFVHSKSLCSLSSVRYGQTSSVFSSYELTC